ncbi:elongation factor 1-gamma-like [Gouania willdenowi]|uniref:elongation factor 1-gamma-like n=1 Tax=Gouania willdenowi TaxID=441366 RepID=UPI001054239A|nr:elongation factor 1-gamma-like [Gouania willdenowi]
MLKTLFTYPENWRAFKAQIAAQYSGDQLKVASSYPAFTFGLTNRTPAFLNNFPLGKVPAYQGDDGICLSESNAIAHYCKYLTLKPKIIDHHFVDRERKLDPDSEECQTKVKEYFTMEGDFKHMSKAFGQAFIFT